MIHRRLRAVLAAGARPPYITAGHFYSPLTGPDDIRRALLPPGDAPGVDLREDAQLALAAELLPILEAEPPGPRYRPGGRNVMFGPADAAAYRAMLTHVRPARVIEVGSGWSTAVAIDEAGSVPELAGLEITCIEPYPAPLLAILREQDDRRVTVLRAAVQDVGLSAYERLGPGDILFIDSSHVAKPGSDVIWLVLHVLPRLAAGVVVHVHDVFWPFTYPAAWLRERRDWTEAYLLHAFLSGNDSWEVVLFSSWLWRCHPEAVPARLAGAEPGSLWLRKVR
jgi:Methyltransferase domain